MKLLHGIPALALVLLFSTLALADTIPTDPHMIPGACSGCGSTGVIGNIIGSVSTDANGMLPGASIPADLFMNNNAFAWTTLEIVVHAPIIVSPLDNYNDPALLPLPNSTSWFVAFGTPTITTTSTETFLFYPALLGLLSVQPGQDLGLFGNGLPPNTQFDLFANGSGPAVPTPEPTTLALLLTGIAGVVGRRRLRKHRTDHS